MSLSKYLLCVFYILKAKVFKAQRFKGLVPNWLLKYGHLLMKNKSIAFGIASFKLLQYLINMHAHCHSSQELKSQFSGHNGKNDIII